MRNEKYDALNTAYENARPALKEFVLALLIQDNMDRLANGPILSLVSDNSAPPGTAQIRRSLG